MGEKWHVLLPVEMDDAGPRSIKDIADVTWLGEYETYQAVLDDIEIYDAIICRGASLEVTEELLKRAKNLKIVSKHGIGVNNIDIEASSKWGVLVTNTPGSNVHAVAEHTIGLLLAVRKQLLIAAADVRSGEWDRSKYVASEIRGSTFGLFGCGSTGRKTASIVSSFGATCLAYDPYLAEEDMPVHIEKVPKTELFERSDIISVHAPLTDETRNAITSTELQHLSPGILLNTSRGGIVNESDLTDSLERGEISGAGLDTLTNEPPNSDNPLLELENVVVTPHIAGYSVESAEATSLQAAENVRAVYKGYIPQDTLNISQLFDVPNQ